ncbi:MAG: DUF4197 domain-containing protein [Pseudomonadota bacterium]
MTDRLSHDTRKRRLPLWALAFAAATAMLSACETTDTAGLGAVIGDVLATQGAGASELSTLEIEQGLREALTIGTERVADQLGATDGYFADPQIKIPLPGRLGDLQSGLSRVGLSAPLDELELKLNRAAESAIPDGKRLVIGAVQQITLQDAVGILNGESNAATQYLRSKTEAGLREALAPHMDQALTSTGAFSTLDTVVTNNGLGALSADLKNDLASTAVDKGLDGLFFYLASEEQKIRENPVARTTDILRKVFGAAA